MDHLQSTFYVVGIIFMTLYGILLIGILVLLFYIWRKIASVTHDLNERLSSMKYVTDHPQEVATSVGQAVADIAIQQVKKIFNK